MRGCAKQIPIRKYIINFDLILKNFIGLMTDYFQSINI
jgi:hypothetical protein